MGLSLAATLVLKSVSRILRIKPLFSSHEAKVGVARITTAGFLLCSAYILDVLWSFES
jgi:hypothetical protein